MRFGDPETEVLLPLFESDVLETIAAVARGELAKAPRLRFSQGAALTVVCASRGYPASAEKGRVIEGLEEDAERGDSVVFHAGTERRGNDVVTAGGRVLAVTGMGSTLLEAREAAYRRVGSIRFDGMFHRRDIGARAASMQEAR